ncbi:hypothetical protein BRC94_12105 [Halobacteriales archaeon QS_5_70_17]|nr:MAG: hypothetical protein BRC94_12105 [Halobacteriales archaeon QS_5_70_17]
MTRRERIAGGGAAGAAAWLLGYSITYLAAADRVERNAHFADVRVRGMGGARTFDLLSRAGSQADLLYLLPPLALLAAGAVAAAGVRTPRAGAIGGAATTAGYLLATVAAALVSNHEFGGGIAAGVPLGPALLLAGVAYPLVFGTAGGAAVAAVRAGLR